ncbi:MAG TPA: DUF1036 domain-containing protein [Caulobacteraceae bacterium]|jgi:hypothetical protein
MQVRTSPFRRTRTAAGAWIRRQLIAWLTALLVVASPGGGSLGAFAQSPPADDGDHFMLTICNATGDTVSAIFAHIRDDGQYEIQGWYDVGNAACTSFGPYRRASFRAFYVSKAGWKWDGDASYCISNKAYDRVNTSDYNCADDEYAASFISYNITAPTYEVDLNGLAPPGNTPPVTNVQATSQSQLAYDTCASDWSQLDWPSKPASKVLVAGSNADGNGGFTGTCMGVWGQPNLAAAINAALSNCSGAGYSGCFVYAENEGLTYWAETELQSVSSGARNQPQEASNDGDDNGGGDNSGGGDDSGAAAAFMQGFVQGLGGAAAAYGAANNGASGGGGGSDATQVVNECRSKAEQVYPNNDQLGTIQRAGCLDYCASVADRGGPGQQELYNGYVTNNTNAQNLCSAGQSCPGNTINTSMCTP